MGYSGAGGETDSWKNQKQKISWHCPFKNIALILIIMFAMGMYRRV